MNNNITEDYCSFEVSKLLKEKGFEIGQNTYFDKKGKIYFFKTYMESNRDIPNVEYWRPSHALAIKWIRENFGIHILLDCGKELWYYQCSKVGTTGTLKTGYAFKSPEEATEAALLYTLKNLIS